MKKNVHIALVMMVKNEQKRLNVTLNSVLGYVDSLVIYDTGSTDNTIGILNEYSEVNNIPLRLKQGEFINFSISRNIMLDFADTFDDIDYLLLLDCNDELCNGKLLNEYSEEFLSENNDAFYVCQEWWDGNVILKYYNIRFIKSRKGWRYRGSVHEYIVNEINNKKIVKLPDIVIYQDRTLDDDKTINRFVRDKQLLLEEHNQNLLNERVLFYLAQTCYSLGEYGESYKYYKNRIELNGFEEEKFISYLKLGEIGMRLGYKWENSLGWFMKAFEHSIRVEPLLYISKYYMDNKKWLLAFTFLSISRNILYPVNSLLFVDKLAYDYTRWHYLGKCCYYINEFKIGKGACEIAIKYGKDKGINIENDIKNLKKYEVN